MPSELDRVRAALEAESAPSSDFDLNPGVVLPDGRKLRQAAVLVLLTGPEDALQVVLTKRASGLKHHPGQIAFPGGKLDASDASLEAAALREAREEVGLPDGHATILGRMPCHETVTGFEVTPILARCNQPFEFRPEPGEVAEAFCAPVAYVTNAANFLIEGRRWQGQTRRYYAVPFGPYYIWGATARILRGLSDRMSHV